MLPCDTVVALTLMLAVGFAAAGALGEERVTGGTGKLVGVWAELPPQLLNRGMNTNARIVSQGNERAFPVGIFDGPVLKFLRGSSSGQSCNRLTMA